MRKSSHVVVVAVLVAAMLAGLHQDSATAEINDGTSPGWSIYGNFTLDDHPDTATLGHDPLGCTIKVDRVYNYGLTSTRWYRYVIPGITDFRDCPRGGTAVATGKPWTVDDLVLSWTGTPAEPAPLLYVLRNFAFTGQTIPNDPNPAKIGSGTDFNGDGLKDFWELGWTEGMRIFYRSGESFVLSSPAPWYCNDDTSRTDLDFAELNGKPGVEVVASYYCAADQPGFPGSAGRGVIVVSPATGKRQILLSDHDVGSVFESNITDYNGDHLLDIEIRSSFNFPVYYLNDGAGRFSPA